MLRLLEDDGWELRETTGSHRHFVHPSKPGKVTVPGHPSKDLHPKTTASILQAGGAAMTDFHAEAEKYLILIEGGPPSNYSAWSPDVLGCVAVGDTVEEVTREMREALALHLKNMARDGEPLPEPLGPGVYLAA